MVEVGGYLARTEERQGKLALALSSIDAAINANKNIPDELYFVPRNLALKAEIVYQLGQKREAENLYKKSTVLIDALLAHAPTRNVERLLLTELSEVYTGYFVAMSDEHDYASALRVLEEARGRIEAQALLRRELIQPHTPTPEEKKLTGLNLALIDAADENSRQDITRQIYDTELQVYGVDSLEGITATRPIRLNHLQSQLGNDELLIEYVLATHRSFAMAVTRTSVHVYALADQTSIESAVSGYRNRLQTGKKDDALGARLYDVLLRPVLELRDKSQLIIVPDGNLHLLPFDALVHADKYLLATHTVSVAPSATVLGILRARGTPTQATALPFLGVAGWTDTSSMTTGFVRAIFPLNKDRLVPLPESKEEVESIASILPKPSTILLGSDATEARFKSLPLAEYNVLHFALHGYVDEEYPDRSALILAPPRKQGNEDGLLQVREIRTLHLNANLVTLSACNTGVGPVGEAGVANLVNAFIEAGATSVVSTLWEVEDRSTEKLMTDFYENLAEHKPKATALRQAQLDLMAKGSGPHYWASFQLVGEPVGTI
jgi:CHAT domain-containing protein